MKYLLIAMRPYQWIKNFFIYLPLFFGQQFFNGAALLKTTIAFFIFSLAASTVYLINDIIDLESDRKHPVKKLRPLASGKITIFQAELTAFILGSVSVFFSFVLDIRLGLIIMTYLVLNFIYMLILKDAVIIDVFCLGAFYYLRILGGSISSNVILSNWFIFCTVLLALFIGFNKRRYDLILASESKVVYTKYTRYFIDRIISIILASVVISYTLYTMDQHTIQRFGTPHMFYTIPFVYYGIFRYLYLLDKGNLGSDPTLVLLKDWKMQLNLLLWIIACLAIIYFRV
jgi:4-hydroxybenzoate polyprenyltransferase